MHGWRSAVSIIRPGVRPRAQRGSTRGEKKPSLWRRHHSFTQETPSSITIHARTHTSYLSRRRPPPSRAGRRRGGLRAHKAPGIRTGPGRALDDMIAATTYRPARRRAHARRRRLRAVIAELLIRMAIRACPLGVFQEPSSIPWPSSFGPFRARCVVSTPAASIKG